MAVLFFTLIFFHHCSFSQQSRGWYCLYSDWILSINHDRGPTGSSQHSRQAGRCRVSILQWREGTRHRRTFVRPQACWMDTAAPVCLRQKRARVSQDVEKLEAAQRAMGTSRGAAIVGSRWEISSGLSWHDHVAQQLESTSNHWRQAGSIHCSVFAVADGGNSPVSVSRWTSKQNVCACVGVCVRACVCVTTSFSSETTEVLGHLPAWMTNKAIVLSKARHRGINVV